MSNSSDYKFMYKKMGEENICEKVLCWWHKLIDNKGARARLRRCDKLYKAVLNNEVFRLKRDLDLLWLEAETVALLAAILACLDNDCESDNEGLMTKLAKPKDQYGKIPFSETRFRKLMSSKDREELFMNLRRAVKIIDNKVSPLIMTDIILSWDWEFKKRYFSKSGSSIIFRLSNEYYNEFLKHQS